MGMKIATKTNVRTTQAAQNQLQKYLCGGTGYGTGVAGLAVLGLTGFFHFLFIIS
jgi:K(+)-stimulated pyrophosphate-energized sodium pump